MSRSRSNPFRTLPQPDPAPDANGIIWAEPHAHVVALSEAFATVQSALAAHRRAEPGPLMAAWMFLTHSCFIGGQLALCNVALLEMGKFMETNMLRLIDTGERTSIPNWAAEIVSQSHDQRVKASTFAQGLLDDFRSAAVQFIATGEPTTKNQRDGDSALLSVALFNAYRTRDGAAVDALLHESTDPIQCMWALFGLHDVIVSVLSTQADVEFDEAAAQLSVKMLQI